MDKKKLTKEEAETMLAELTEHYHQPVLPMSDFCNAISTWFRCIEKNNLDTDKNYNQGSAYYKHLSNIETDIRKSNLLGRLLYGGEKLRNEKCPKHLGRWSGIGDCEHGCDLTGWLPKKS